MTIPSAMTLNWAIILGAVTLLCWMAAGFTAVLGMAGGASKYASTGLAVTGLVALIVMSAVLGLAK